VSETGTATPKEKLLREILLPSSALAVDASRDGRRVYASCLDGTVLEIDADTGKTLEIGRHGNYASGVVLVEDEIVISAGYDGVLQWHDGAGKKIREVEAHDFWSWQLAASTDGKLVASSTGQYLCGGYRYEPAPEREPSVKVFDVASGRLVHAFPHLPPVQSVAFSPDGAHLAAANLMGDVRVWSLATGEEVARWRTSSLTGWGIIKGHYYTGGIFSMAFTPDGSELYVAGMGSTRDPAAGNGRQLWQRFDWMAAEPTRLDETHDGENGQGLMETIRFHPSGEHFVMGGRTHKGSWNVAFFEAASGKRLHAMSTKHRVTEAVYAARGRRLFLAGAVSQGKPRKGGDFQPFGRVKIYELEG